MLPSTAAHCRRGAQAGPWPSCSTLWAGQTKMRVGGDVCLMSALSSVRPRIASAMLRDYAIADVLEYAYWNVTGHSFNV
jgi:hypothetical protein